MTAKSVKLFVLLLCCTTSAVAGPIRVATPALPPMPPMPPLPPGFVIPDPEETEVVQTKGVALGMNAQSSLPAPGDPGTGGDPGTNNGVPPPIVYSTNVVWVESVRPTNGIVGLNVHNLQVWGSDRVLALESKTNLGFSTWNIEQDFHAGTNSVWSTSVSATQSNLFLQVVDWTDAQTNGLPLWWEWEQFGRIDLDPNSDPGGSGNSLLYDYQNNIDPNNIQFSLKTANLIVNNNGVPVQLTVSGGIPSSLALLVDSTNFMAATWADYNSAPNINLGNEGWHRVWVGLRGRQPGSKQSWRSLRLKLDYTAPVLVITNPVQTTVTQPMLQIQGYCAEPLASLFYDLTNAAGRFTNQQAMVLDQHFDTNVWSFTTNTFQAFDVPVTNGPNVFTFYATDLAGNSTTTNLTFTLNYSAKTNGPTIQVYWPQNGAQISGSNFTCRGWMDDFTAKIKATIVNTNGVTNTTTGIVERDGTFWLSGMPLGGGTNQLKLVATNAAGRAATNTIQVVRNALALTMNPVSSDQLWLPAVNVSGTISSPALSVRVNGIAGTNNGDGTWNAGNVPVNPGGVATFSLSASGSNTVVAEVQQDKPTEMYVREYTIDADFGSYDSTDIMSTNGIMGNWDDEAENTHVDQSWKDGLGGLGSFLHSFRTDNNISGYLQTRTTQTTWTANGDGTEFDSEAYPSYTNNWTTEVGPPLIEYEHCDVSDRYDVTSSSPAGNGASQVVRIVCTYQRDAQTTVKLRTGGKASPGTNCTFLVSASASEVLHGDAEQDLPAGAWPTEKVPGLPTEVISSTSIYILGKRVGTNGTVSLTLPLGAERDVTARVSGVDFYMFNVSATRTQ